MPDTSDDYLALAAGLMAVPGVKGEGEGEGLSQRDRKFALGVLSVVASPPTDPRIRIDRLRQALVHDVDGEMITAVAGAAQDADDEEKDDFRAIAERHDREEDEKDLGELWNEIFQYFDGTYGGEFAGRLAQAAVDAMRPILAAVGE